MATLLGIAGSLRRGSYNAALLRAAARLAPESLRIDIASIAEIPLYNGDVEAEGMPPPVTELKERLAAADGLLLATPEYNNSIPGVLKNVIDWMSRPPKDIPRVFGDKIVGLMGASPGRFGTVLSQAAWLPVLRTLGTRPFFGSRLLVGEAAKSFDAAGELADERIREGLTAYLAGLAKFSAR
jgi:chromate reductase, NAD(P)H dehydrogenase (quinone)